MINGHESGILQNLTQVSDQPGSPVQSSPLSTPPAIPTVTIKPRKVEEVRLEISGLLTSGGHSRALTILIDTGAEINVMAQGLFPPGVTKAAKHPMNIIAANQEKMGGGDRELWGVLELLATEVDTERPHKLQAPVQFYIADMKGVEAIISYKWLAENGLMVNPRRHGLNVWGIHEGEAFWVPGIKKGSRIHTIGGRVATPGVAPSITYPIVPPPGKLQGKGVDKGVQTSLDRPRRMLDLFCGTGSVGQVFREQGWQVVSVDWDPKYQPTLIRDIGAWDYWLDFPPGHFDVVACSPPCTEFSSAMTRRARDLEYADHLVVTTLNIISYLQPDFWFLENPRGGLLKDRPYMGSYPYVDVDYCRFATWGYKKPTRIWGSSHVGTLPPQLCDGATCASMHVKETGKMGHHHRLGQTPDPGLKRVSQQDLYRIPPGLIHYLMDWHPDWVPVINDRDGAPHCRGGDQIWTILIRGQIQHNQGQPNLSSRFRVNPCHQKFLWEGTCLSQFRGGQPGMLKAPERGHNRTFRAHKKTFKKLGPFSASRACSPPAG